MTETANATPETVEVQVKPYTFRKLNSTDIFLMFRIISKIGIKEFSSVMEHNGIKGLVARLMREKIENAEETGEGANVSVTYISVILEVADVVFRCLPRCEAELYQMLAKTSDLTEDQVKALSMADFTMMVVDFVKKEEFVDFYKAVSALFK